MSKKRVGVADWEFFSNVNFKRNSFSVSELREFKAPSQYSSKFLKSSENLFGSSTHKIIKILTFHAGTIDARHFANRIQKLLRMFQSDGFIILSHTGWATIRYTHSVPT